MYLNQTTKIHVKQKRNTSCNYMYIALKSLSDAQMNSESTSSTEIVCLGGNENSKIIPVHQFCGVLVA